MKESTEKVALVTGAGSGIGRELARLLAARGYKLALNDRNENGLEETWDMLPLGSRGIKRAYDVSDRSATERFVADAASDLGRLDVVVNNAGMSLRQKLVEQTKVEDFERTLGVNLWGVIYGSLAALPHLRKTEGSLVNVSSVFGLFAFPGSGPYNVSKFAVRGFTETLRVETRDTGIHIACVHPGGILTNIHRNVEIENEDERERFIRNFEKNAPTTAVEAASVIVKGIEARNPRILIGRDARFIDKITRLMPASYEKVLARWFKPERFL